MATGDERVHLKGTDVVRRVAGIGVSDRDLDNIEPFVIAGCPIEGGVGSVILDYERFLSRFMSAEAIPQPPRIEI
jgi:hypothetical protein